MKITKEEVIAIDNLISMLRGATLSEVELLRSAALVYSLLSDAVEDMPEFNSAEYFDKAVKMAIESTHVIKHWEKKTNMLTNGLLLEANVHPATDKFEGRLMANLVIGEKDA